MLTLKSPEVVQEMTLRWKRDHRIALVPTMGALHEGHLALVRRAKAEASKVVATIFVNPLQFGVNEDLEKYPRPFEEDQEKLEREGVDLLFHPTPREMYPDGFATQVKVGALAEHLCGKSRPGHFDGVATVCLKLFQISQPDFAVFGEKDFQQFRVLQQMVADLNLPLSLLAHPTIREADGLALSSRNRYLGENDRALATQLPRGTNAAREEAARGNATVGAVLHALREAAGSEPRFDYASVCSETDLIPRGDEELLSAVSRPRLFWAARLGATRLIDNAALPGGT